MKYKLLSIICVTTILFIGKAKANKDTMCISIRPSNETGTEISTQNPNSNLGTSNIFYCATWTCSGPTCLDRGLIQFDLSAIPNNVTITNASMLLYADNSASVGIAGQPTYGSNNAGWLKRVTSAWAPNSVTWNTQPTTTNVNEATLAQSINTSENYAVNVTQLVGDIIASGNNYGFEIIQQNESTPYQSLIFGSSSNADTILHPQLQICYVVNSEPGDSCISLRPYDTNGTIISTQNPNSNLGASNLFYSATWTCSGPTCLDRGFIKFNLSGIPNNATITSAALSLYADNGASVGISGQPTYGSNNAAWLQRITSAWTYNTITWNTQPTTTVTDEVPLSQSINTSENYTLNVTQLITDIIASGNNYGFEILQQNESTPYQSLIFGSSTNTDSTLRPKLDICFSVSSASVTPTYNPNINIEVYPNPAKDEVVFKTSSSENVKDYYVEIYNELGQEVRNFQLYPYQVTINTSDLARGLYLYKIVSNNSIVKTGKIELE